MPLERLLGIWDFRMLHSTMAEPITGRQRYEPVLDGAFVHLSQRFTARFVGSDAMETNGQ